MSLVIKGMEMPKNCGDCWFEHAYEFCESKYEDCPLIELPPHGDLIDRRYAIATACSGRIRTLPTTEDGENWIRVEEVRESIKNAPTIIPAEEGE